MVSIRCASNIDFPIIQEIAYKTWPETYGEILSKEQLNFMLDKFYSIDYLNFNLENQHLFYIIDEDENPLGFIGIQHNSDGRKSTKIHKIYVLPNNQGRGIGTLAIDYVIDLAQKNDSESVILNVNRFNKALFFYQKIGFNIIEEIDIEIGNGYLMEDFVLKKQL